MIRAIRLGGYAAAFFLMTIEFIGLRDFSKSPYIGVQHKNLIVAAIESAGPNRDCGLRTGDRIVRVNGIATRNVSQFSYLLSSMSPGSSFSLEVARADSLVTIIARAVQQPKEHLAGKFSLTAVGFIFVVVGLVVLLKRTDIMAVLFTAICYTLSYLITEHPLSFSAAIQFIEEFLRDLFFIFFPALMLHFFLVFPGRLIERGTRRERFLRFIYIPPTALAISTLAAMARQYASALDTATIGFIEKLNATTAIFWVAYIATGLAAFVRTYAVSERVQRIKFRIVILGVIIGIVPITVVMLAKQFNPMMEVPARYIWPLFLSFMPISFAYAILKHDALDLGLAVRKSLVYALLVVFVLAAYYASLNFLGEEIGRSFGIPGQAIAAIAIVLLALAIAPVREGLAKAIDRSLLRRQPKLTDEVVSFSREIQFLPSTDDICSLMARYITDTFRSDRCYVFIKADSGNYELHFSRPEAAQLPLTSFPKDMSILKLLSQERTPMMVEYYDKLWIKSNLDRISQELLSISKAAVAIPLMEQQELLGFVLAGKKGSGRPYDSSEAEILELLSERAAVAIMNIGLCRDSLAKKKLEEELLLASKIQARLLPTRMPHFEYSDIFGKLANSREVGGDFYAFLQLSPGIFGIAVADVSGKGIPAALLMTSLQSWFRAEAAKCMDPSIVLSTLNALMFESSDPEKFATFFYAIYDDRTGLFRFSNAGSWPPLLFLGSGRISRLKRGGPPIGLERESVYTEGIVKLESGDLVVIVTDGCLDQENPTGEPFGEKRIIEFVRNNIDLPLEDLAEKLFATLIAFGQKSLKDDMTAVLLRRGKGRIRSH